MNRSFSAHDLAAIAMSVALIAVCSWISVPTTIPFTMQTFAVCLVAAVFGLRHGVWAVLCYILLGAVGAPVFAGFSGGFGVLLGTTGGYILGFVFTALENHVTYRAQIILRNRAVVVMGSSAPECLLVELDFLFLYATIDHGAHAGIAQWQGFEPRCCRLSIPESLVVVLRTFFDTTR